MKSFNKGIASKNPAKFNLTNADIESRRQFINQTREFVQVRLINRTLFLASIIKLSF